VPPPGPANDVVIDALNLLSVASVHGCPQGEILQAIHDQVVSYRWYMELDSDFFKRLHSLLTRQEGWLETHFEILIRQYNEYIALLSKVPVLVN